MNLRSKIVIMLFFSFSALSGCRFSNNFHEVDPGHFYRSGQLSKHELSEIVKHYGIKTVINLRGEQPGRAWYDDEMKRSSDLGAEFYSLNMRAKQIPDRDVLVRLLDLYQTAKRPILVHCLSGTDRSGEAAAIYQILYMHKSKEEAKDMLSLRFGHLSFFTPAKHYFIGLFGGEAWARNEYQPCSGQYKYYDVKNPVCLTGKPVNETHDDR